MRAAWGSSLWDDPASPGSSKVRGTGSREPGTPPALSVRRRGNAGRLRGLTSPHVVHSPRPRSSPWAALGARGALRWTEWQRTCVLPFLGVRAGLSPRE